MKFAGMIKTSTVDYPKKLVSTIFTGGCNFKCEYCHNCDLIDIKNEDLFVSENEIIEHLKKRKTILDGLCISGGEPTLWGDSLLEFIKKVRKELGEEFLIKIDTNGSQLETLTEIIKYVDFVAMDIKGFDYSLFSKNTLKDILKTAKILEKAKDYEIRVTMYPEYIKEDKFEELSEVLIGVKKVAIQQFNPKKVYKNKGIKPFDIEVLEKFENILKNKGINVELRY